MEEPARMSLSLSGVGKASGGCYKDVNIEGVGTVEGDIECDSCMMKGVATIHGSIHAKTVHVEGKTSIRGNLACETLLLLGQIKIDGKCEAETFTGTGSYTVTDLLNAGEIHVKTQGLSKVGEIGAESIRIEKEPGRTLFSRWKTLSVETIEGDDIYLENTRASVVRGRNVVIGKGCDVDLVEYETLFQKHDGSIVRKQSKR